MIWCSIQISQQKAEFACKVHCKQSDWQQSKQIATGENSEYINEHLQQIVTKLLQIKLNLQAQNQLITPLLVKQIFLGQTSAVVTFVECYQQYQQKKIVSQSTLKKYSTICKHFKAFFGTLTPAQITLGQIEDFEHYLKTNKKISAQEYIYKAVCFIKATLLYCKRRQIPIHEPALLYEIKKGKPKPIVFLTAEQFALIESFSHSSEHLNRCRDLAIFQRHTGFAYVDMVDFDFVKDTIFEKGVYWIYKKRNKTEQVTLLPLFPQAKRILEKYGHKLPVISNQKYNAYLSTIGEIVGLPVKLTSHMLRKTAGMLWLQSGIPYALVSKMLGHASIQTTQRHYVQVDLITMKKFFSSI